MPHLTNIPFLCCSNDIFYGHCYYTRYTVLHSHPFDIVFNLNNKKTKILFFFFKLNFSLKKKQQIGQRETHIVSITNLYLNGRKKNKQTKNCKTNTKLKLKQKI